MDSERLYARLPVLAQHIAVSAFGYRIEHRRYNRDFDRLLTEATERLSWSQERVEAYRDRRLSAFVAHAAATTPYYRQLFRELDLDPRDIQGLDDLSKIPITPKKTVRDNPSAFFSDAIADADRIWKNTAGTTGSALRFPVTTDCIREMWVVWWRYRGLHGIKKSTWCGTFVGRTIAPMKQYKPPFWRTNRPGKQVFFSIYHLSERTFRSYVDEINRRRLPWIHGFPSTFAHLADLMIRHNVRFHDGLRHVTLGAERRLTAQSEIIEEAFGVKPRQHYGLSEVVANISEWPDGILRVDEDYSAIEFVPADNGLPMIVGTNFTNPAFPLLRYACGDGVVLRKQAPGEIHWGRTVDAIDGRLEDYLVLSDGTHLGRLDRVFDNIGKVTAAQLYQKEAGKFTVRLVPGPDFGPDDEQLIRRELDRRIGDNRCTYDFEYLEKIPQTREGKLKFVLNEIPSARIGP